eukprot:3611502-Amphidinium_carterae.1
MPAIGMALLSRHESCLVWMRARTINLPLVRQSLNFSGCLQRLRGLKQANFTICVLTWRPLLLVTFVSLSLVRRREIASEISIAMIG